jgi:hypothetical protein
VQGAVAGRREVIEPETENPKWPQTSALQANATDIPDVAASFPAS